MSRPQLSHAFIQVGQRRRIIDAALTGMAERGYTPITVADLVKGAGIARNTFYENFANKPDACRAALMAASDDILNRIQAAVDGNDRGVAVIGALLDLAEESNVVRVMVFSGPVGEPELYEETLDRIAELTALPELTGRLYVGGAVSLIRQRLSAGEALDDLRDDLTKLFATHP